jgi:hypothetical protein
VMAKPIAEPGGRVMAGPIASPARVMAEPIANPPGA